jgi:hypothetical protein
MSVDHFISTGNLPPPVTLEQLGARILAQERAGTGKVGTEGTSSIVLISHSEVDERTGDEC